MLFSNITSSIVAQPAWGGGGLPGPTVTEWGWILSTRMILSGPQWGGPLAEANDWQVVP